MTISLETYSKLLAIRAKLNNISDLSYNFHRLEKLKPISDISEEREAVQLLIAYKRLLREFESKQGGTSDNK